MEQISPDKLAHLTNEELREWVVELAAALAMTLDCSELNADEIEEETEEVIDQGAALLSRLERGPGQPSA